MDILSLFLGSALTILGGYLSNRQTSALSHGTDLRKMRREKLEQLASLAFSLEDWIQKMEEDAFSVPMRHTPSEPMEQMYMLSALYFPEVETQVFYFCHIALELCKCILKEAGRRLLEDGVSNEYAKEYLAIHKEMLNKREALIKILRSIAQSLDV
jgi:hypothetical protein